jgi:hypothetical protein
MEHFGSSDGNAVRPSCLKSACVSSSASIQSLPMPSEPVKEIALSCGFSRNRPQPPPKRLALMERHERAAGKCSLLAPREERFISRREMTTLGRSRDKCGGRSRTFSPSLPATSRTSPVQNRRGAFFCKWRLEIRPRFVVGYICLLHQTDVSS